MNRTEAVSIANSPVDLSVIIPISERHDDIRTLFSAYKAAVENTRLPYEFIFVLDGEFPEAMRDLQQLITEGEKIKIIKLAKWFGEATALTVGFEHSSGPALLTLPAYFQVEPAEIPRLVAELGDNDMIVARRWPRSDSIVNRIQSRAFHLPIRFLTKLDFQDLGCGVRVFKRRVLDEVSIYGDQHRFLPLLAHRQGFKVVQSDASQAEQDTKKRQYSIGVYLRRVLDILSIFFLLKFAKKPMRFFGLLGSGVFGAGALILLTLAFQRLIWSVPLSDRPMLLLGSLLLVLGIQIFAIGLVGEIIIFTHAKNLKEYTIEKIVN